MGGSFSIDSTLPQLISMSDSTCIPQLTGMQATSIMQPQVTSADSIKRSLSIEEIDKANRKKREQKAALYAKQAENEQLQKENNKLQAQLAKGKQKDGSAHIVKDFKDLTGWEKTKIAGMNMLKGIGNVCKSLVGIEADGKFNWKKCLRNVVIAAGTVVLCCFAPPVAAAVAAGLGASAATAATCATVASGAVTALTYAGLAAGTVKTGKGIYDACQADTTEEFDKATQDIGQGAFIALTSRAGLKAGARTAGTLTSITKPHISAEASMLQRLWANTKYAGACVAQEGKNLLPTRLSSWKFWKKTSWTTSDYFKVAGVQGKIASEAAQNAVAPTAATNIFGRFSNWCSRKTGWYRVSSARQAIKNIPVKKARNEFNNAFTTTKNNIETQISAIETKLNDVTLTNLQKVTLEHQRTGLYKVLCKLDEVKTHSDWRTLRKLSAQIAKDTGRMRGKWYTRPFTGGKDITIESNTFKRADLLDDLAIIKTEQEALAAEIQQLTRLKMESMSQMATMSSSSRLSRQVSDFGFSSRLYARPLNWAKTKWDVGTSGFEKAMGVMNAGFIVMEPWWALQPVVKQAACQPVNMLTLFYDPVIDKPEGETIDEKTVAALEEKYKKEAETLKTQLSQIESKLESYQA